MKFAVRGYDDNFGVGQSHPQLTGNFDPVQTRHPDIEENDVRSRFNAEGHGVFAVIRFGDDLVFSGKFFQYRPQILSLQRFVIGDHNLNHSLPLSFRGSVSRYLIKGKEICSVVPLFCTL